jgi:hypothetical protein
MEAIGLAKLADTDQLIGGQVKIKLKVEASEQYGDKNQVAAFATTGKTVAPSPAAKPAASAPPWAR